MVGDLRVVDAFPAQFLSIEFSGGIGAGYTHILSRDWNIEFGAGLWGGQTAYRTYRCTNCGSVVDQGRKFFILPDDLYVSLIFVF